MTPAIKTKSSGETWQQWKVRWPNEAAAAKNPTFIPDAPPVTQSSPDLCPTCLGTRNIYDPVMVEDEDGDLHIVTYLPMRCGTCKGSGRVDRLSG